MNPVKTKPITLRRASAEGDSELVQQLLADGCAVREFDDSALRSALRHKQAIIVKDLLAAGADLKNHAEEFLGIAARNGDCASLKQLLPRLLGANGMPPDPRIIESALQTAIVALKPKSVRILVAGRSKLEADISKAIYLAAKHGSVEILKILRKSGSDLFAERSPALKAASEGRQPQVVEFLLSNGAFSDEVMSASVCAAVEFGDLETLEILMQHGGKLLRPNAIIGVTNNDSLDVLLFLEEHGHSYRWYADELAESAIERNAPRVLDLVITMEDVSKGIIDNGLKTAVETDAYKILEILINAKADAGVNGSIALQIAIASNRFKMAKLLLGANAKASDLDCTAIKTIFEHEQWWLLPDLFRGGIAVTGLKLSPEDAVNLFLHFPAEAMATDSAGKLHSDSVLNERVKFTKATAKIATQHQLEAKTMIATCLHSFISLLPPDLLNPDFGPSWRRSTA